MTAKTPAAAPPKSRSRCSWSPEERGEWLALFEQSGQSHADFCRTNGIPESTMSLWRKQMRSAPVDASHTGEFVEVALAAEPIPAAAVRVAPIVVHLADGLCLEVAPGTDIVWLAELVRMLRGA
jgi:transposase-like protein